MLYVRIRNTRSKRTDQGVKLFELDQCSTLKSHERTPTFLIQMVYANYILYGDITTYTSLVNLIEHPTQIRIMPKGN